MCSSHLENSQRHQQTALYTLLPPSSESLISKNGGQRQNFTINRPLINKTKYLQKHLFYTVTADMVPRQLTHPVSKIAHGG